MLIAGLCAAAPASDCFPPSRAVSGRIQVGFSRDTGEAREREGLAHLCLTVYDRIQFSEHSISSLVFPRVPIGHERVYAEILAKVPEVAFAGLETVASTSSALEPDMAHSLAADGDFCPAPVFVCTEEVGCAARIPFCVGDCDGDGNVTIEEIQLVGRISRGEEALGRCRTADVNNDEVVDANEALTLTSIALHRCPSAGELQARNSALKRAALRVSECDDSSVS